MRMTTDILRTLRIEIEVREGREGPVQFGGGYYLILPQRLAKPRGPCFRAFIMTFACSKSLSGRFTPGTHGPRAPALRFRGRPRRAPAGPRPLAAAAGRVAFGRAP